MSSESAPTTEETWHGSCHCGAQAFTVNLQQPLYEQNVSSCNCSICHLNGYLFIYPFDKDITWTSGGPNSTSSPTLTSYTFNQGRFAHWFCSRCGTSIYSHGTTPDFYPDNTALNVRAFKDVDIEKLKLSKIDGRSA